MRFTVITLFPELIETFGRTGVIGRGRERGLVVIDTVNPRAFAGDRRGTVDDTPYGGGPGMVMMASPLRRAIAAARARGAAGAHVAYLTPQGRRFDQSCVATLAGHRHLILLAGRYEGIDERVVARDVDSEWSVGDFVVSGGEVPAMLLIDAVTRTLPGALGDARSAAQDSFAEGLLDHPHYTRPELCDGDRVPAVLLSGDHGAIERWRCEQRLLRTLLRRPDLLERAALGPVEQAILARLRAAGESSADG